MKPQRFLGCRLKLHLTLRGLKSVAATATGYCDAVRVLDYGKKLKPFVGLKLWNYVQM